MGIQHKVVYYLRERDIAYEKSLRVLLLISAMMLAVQPFAVFAQESTSSVTVLPKQISKEISKTIYADEKTAPPIETVIGELKGDWYNNQAKSINKESFKKSLKEYYNTDPKKYNEQLSNLDMLVNEAVINTSNPVNFRSTSDGISIRNIGEMVIIGEGWVTQPYITSSTEMVTYSQSWLVENNYRSSNPVNVTQSRSLKISGSIGFSGDKLIKDKLGFSTEFGIEQTATVSVGATVNAWTVWGYRPYIDWTKKDYKGKRYYEYVIVGAPQIHRVEYDVTGTNKVLKVKANEYWSRVNASQDVNAATPQPPTGQPL